jgi:hypothetical protein
MMMTGMAIKGTNGRKIAGGNMNGMNVPKPEKNGANMHGVIIITILITMQRRPLMLTIIRRPRSLLTLLSLIMPRLEHPFISARIKYQGYSDAGLAQAG